MCTCMCMHAYVLSLAQLWLRYASPQRAECTEAKYISIHTHTYTEYIYRVQSAECTEAHAEEHACAFVLLRACTFNAGVHAHSMHAHSMQGCMHIQCTFNAGVHAHSMHRLYTVAEGGASGHMHIHAIHVHMHQLRGSLYCVWHRCAAALWPCLGRSVRASLTVHMHIHVPYMYICTGAPQPCGHALGGA